jgi:hypothetical protein
MKVKKFSLKNWHKVSWKQTIFFFKFKLFMYSVTQSPCHIFLAQ